MADRKSKVVKDRDKSSRGHASQFFVAGELCRRGWLAVVTMGNSPNTDILCSNKAGTKFVHIQVKTFLPGNKRCSVGPKAEKEFGENFFWVLGGIPGPESTRPFEYYVIPARVMAVEISREHALWLKTPGRKERAHIDNSIRVVTLPPGKGYAGWDISAYRDRWSLIEERLMGDCAHPQPHDPHRSP
jgi:hypothetical protein